MVNNALPALPVQRELALSSSKGRGKLVSGVPPDLCVVCPLSDCLLLIAKSAIRNCPSDSHPTGGVPVSQSAISPLPHAKPACCPLKSASNLKRSAPPTSNGVAPCALHGFIVINS